MTKIIKSQDGVIKLTGAHYDDVVAVEVKGVMGVESHLSVGFNQSSPSILTTLNSTDLHINAAGTGNIFIRPNDGKVEVVANKVMVNTKDGSKFELSQYGELVINNDVGTEGQVLSSSGQGQPPKWVDPSYYATSPFVARGQVAFGSSDEVVTTSPSLTYDDSEKALTVGVLNPIEINGATGEIISTNNDSPLVLRGGGSDAGIVIGDHGDTLIEGSPMSSVKIHSHGRLTASASNSFRVDTNGDTKLVVNEFGAIGVGPVISQLQYGNTGEVLVSSGENSPPTWRDFAAQYSQIVEYVGDAQYTLKVSDMGKSILAYPVPSMVIVVPSKADLPQLKVGDSFVLTLMNDGRLNIVSSPGVMLRVPQGKLTTPRVMYSTVTFRMVNENEWIVYGDLA